MLRPRHISGGQQPGVVGLPAPAGSPLSPSGPLLPLLLAASIPVLLLAGWSAYRSADEHRDAALRLARETVARVAQSVTAGVSTQLQVAAALAASTALDGPDLPGFHREAGRVAALHPLWHTVAFDDVVRDHAPEVGSIGPVGPMSGEGLVALRVPVIRDGAPRGVVTVALKPDAVADILRGAGLPIGWTAAVVDRSGRPIARTIDAAAAGLPAALSHGHEIDAGSGRPQVGTTRDGGTVVTVSEALNSPGGWSVHLGVPRRDLDTPVRHALYTLAAVAASSLALAAALAVLVSRDLARRRERGFAAAALEASEERAALAVSAADLGTWRWDASRDAITGSERCRTLIDLPDADGEAIWSSQALLRAVHPDDRDGLRAAARGCLAAKAPFAIDFRTVLAPGAPRWFHARGRATAASGGDGIHGILADIGGQKRAEAERADLLRRLAAAQEDVQRRIAHDLHDQVGQTVTGLSLGLKGLEHALDGPASDGAALGPTFADRVRWLQELTGTIGRDLHRVAADLRPTALDDLGLPRALAALATDWSARYEIQADVQVIGSEERLPEEVATAIYRVVQEALTNVLKHARARTVSVVLDRRPRDVRVVIEDDGAGFDPDVPASTVPGARRRLGLLGMRERLGLIGGTLRVESSPGAGTSLFVTIPLDVDQPVKDAP